MFDRNELIMHLEGCAANIDVNIHFMNWYLQLIYITPRYKLWHIPFLLWNTEMLISTSLYLYYTS